MHICLDVLAPHDRGFSHDLFARVVRGTKISLKVLDGFDGQQINDVDYHVDSRSSKE